MSTRVIRPEQGHRAAWDHLYQSYAKFYRQQQTPEMRDRVWGWIHDPSHQVECLLVVADLEDVDPSGGDGVDRHGAGAEMVVGLAHFREFARPLAATHGGYLDDLFVDPSARGTGAAAALLTALKEEARRRDWSVIRWITADDNYRARGLYDKVATRTPWVTYDMAPASTSGEH